MNRKIKILILEDNESDAELIERELNRSTLNFVSETVQTREAYEASIAKFKPDIILSDYSLPSFDGVAAFQIKQIKSPDIPFIIVSGIIGEENAVELIKSGITDYVLKDKLFSLNQKITRALKDRDDIRAKKIADARLKVQNEKLFEIAYLQAHQVRVPVAQIIGLYNLFRFDDPSDPINSEVLSKLRISAESLDNIIREILEKTAEI
jgi:DNA-binding NtrC family response regulator